MKHHKYMIENVSTLHRSLLPNVNVKTMEGPASELVGTYMYTEIQINV